MILWVHWVYNWAFVLHIKSEGCFVYFLSHVQLFVTPWTTPHQASLSLTVSQNLFKLMFIESVMPSNHLILSSPSPPSFNLSQHQGLFQWVSSLHQVVKVLQLQHQSFQWICRVDFLLYWLVWFPCWLRDSQESSPNHNSKASVLWHSAFFMVQLSHPYNL